MHVFIFAMISHIALKEILHDYLADFRDVRNVLSSALSHLVPILEDISSGAKEDQETARYHPSATA